MFRSPHCSRVPEPGRFAEVEALWDDLLRRGTRQPGFRVVRAGVTVAAKDVTRRAGIGNEDLADMIAPNQVVARYRAGDTVVLQGLHHTDRRLAEVANNIALTLDHPVQVNAYFSPEGARGLDLHFDYHDVFVVQLGGSKRWRIWEPLPRTVDPIKGRHTIAKPRFEELGEPLLDLTLTAGDCLYLPRGYPHSAETIDAASEHLTIGLVAVTWQRVVRKAIDAEVAAGRLSSALPVRMLEQSSIPPRAESQLAGLPAQLAPEVVRHWMAREIWRRQPATRLRPRSAPKLSGQRLKFTPGPLIWLTMIGGRAVLGLGDRVLDMPAEALDFLAALLDTQEPVMADDLEGLDDDSRSVLLHRLLAEGMLANAG